MTNHDEVTESRERMIRWMYLMRALMDEFPDLPVEILASGGKGSGACVVNDPSGGVFRADLYFPFVTTLRKVVTGVNAGHVLLEGDEPGQWDGEIVEYPAIVGMVL